MSPFFLAISAPGFADPAAERQAEKLLNTMGMRDAFYATPTGRKTIELLPVLMAQGGQIGMNRVTANMGELEAMIQTESERLRKSVR